MIEQIRFLSTVFLCSKFKLENTYSAVNFCGKMFAVISFICGNLLLLIAGKIAKIRTRKKFVPHGRYLKVVCKIWPLRQDSDHTITNLSRPD